MSDFSVRADHIDVEQIMRQIRTRVRDKRGADYTDAEIRELASVKLDRFLDPRAVRSDLLGHFKRQHQPAPLFVEREEWPPLYAFDPDLAYGSSRGGVGSLLRLVRRLLNPILKLFINPGPILHVLQMQGPINARHRETLDQLINRVGQRLQTRDELDALNFEMFNNLVVETTRLGIEVKNLRMQVESLSTRLEFDERRARALEGVVQYRPGTPLAPAPAPPAAPDDDGDDAAGEAVDAGDGRGPRRRRRRRGRRRGGMGTETGAAPGTETSSAAEDEAGGGDAGEEAPDAMPAPLAADAAGDALPVSADWGQGGPRETEARGAEPHAFEPREADLREADTAPMAKPPEPNGPAES